MKVRGFEIGYIAVVALDLFAMYYYPGLRLISKPLIVASLIIWYVTNVKYRQRPLILCALIFSLFGDILLLFGGAIFFMYGVGSFLLAQVSYALYFRRFGNFKDSMNKIKAAFVVLVAAAFYFVLYNHLGTMKVPVVFYTVALTAMIVFAVVQRLSILIAIGSIFFMISDMSLALQKFVLTDVNLNLFIMITYCIAQYLIVKGIIEGQTTA